MLSMSIIEKSGKHVLEHPSFIQIQFGLQSTSVAHFMSQISALRYDALAAAAALGDT